MGSCQGRNRGTVLPDWRGGGPASGWQEGGVWFQARGCREGNDRSVSAGDGAGTDSHGPASRKDGRQIPEQDGAREASAAASPVFRGRRGKGGGERGFAACGGQRIRFPDKPDGVSGQYFQSPFPIKRPGKSFDGGFPSL